MRALNSHHQVVAQGWSHHGKWGIYLSPGHYTIVAGSAPHQMRHKVLARAGQTARVRFVYAVP